MKFGKSQNICPVCKEDHLPHCCADCGCAITIIAKDKLTGSILPDVGVVLKDLEGTIVKSGTTDVLGMVVFEDVVDDDYIIESQLYNVKLLGNSITKDEFIKCKRENTGIQKEILYTDENFILKGTVVECNTVTKIQGVDILLRDTIKAGQKNTLSDAEGDFVLHLI